MNLKRRISALLLVLVMCLSMVAVPAYAYGNDPDPDYEIVVPTEAPPAETQAATEPQNNSQAETEPTYSEIVPGVSFANDGNVTTRDLLYDEATNKQFISIETKNGAVFYIVIDYDKPVDEDWMLIRTRIHPLSSKLYRMWKPLPRKKPQKQIPTDSLSVCSPMKAVLPVSSMVLLRNTMARTDSSSGLQNSITLSSSSTKCSGSMDCPKL